MQSSSVSVSHFRLSSLVLMLLNYNETKISTFLDFNGQRKKVEIKQDLEFNIDDEIFQISFYFLHCLLLIFFVLS